MFTRRHFLNLVLFTNKNWNSLNINARAFNARNELIAYCEKEFDLPRHRVQSIMLNWPSLQTIHEDQIEVALQSLNKVGIKKDEVIKQPTILNFHPNTIQNRSNVLLESGFQKVNLSLLSRYITLMRKRTIFELKQQGFIPMSINVWNKLVECFNIYPEIQCKLLDTSNYENMTMVQLRMKMLYQFLNLKYGSTQESFDRSLKIYAPLKHRSLKTVSDSLYLAENVLKFPKEKILNFGSVLIMDPENISKIITEIKELGGLDVKDVLYKHPSLLRSNYKSILAIKKYFEEENISPEAQRRCIDVYTLSPKTVKDRIEEIKSNTMLKALIDNPRILSVVYYRNKVFKRLEQLQGLNKKCSSLHKLVSPDDEFSRYAATFGDKTRGIDVIYALKKYMPTSNDEYNIRKKLVRHPFWTHIPLHTMITTIEYLLETFRIEEISQNCELLLYPLEDIKNDLIYIDDLKHSPENTDNTINIKIDVNKITNSQRLSLLLYVLEKNHNFSGNGVWPKQNAECRVVVTQ